MYVRIYNEKLVTIYEKEDLANSEIIGKLKGRQASALSIRKENEYIYHDITIVTAKELQLIVRNLNVVTIAIEMTEEEILDYFMMAADYLEIEEGERLKEELKIAIDAGIINSKLFAQIEEKLIARLKKS